jgi:aryl carrier-like protein
VLKGAGLFQQKAVEEHLKTRLPDYMVPRHYMVLEALPTLPTGKVDRRALPNPFDRIEAAKPAQAAALEPREQEMVNLFKELLQLEDVGPESDFIKMGGDSLLMALLMHRVYQTCGVEINFDAFVESPTPARLAGLIETATAQEGAHAS